VRLLSFTAGGTSRVGVLEGHQIEGLDVTNMRALFEMGPPQTHAHKLKTGERFALSDVKLAAPIIPKKFFHTAGNFREHAKEGGKANWVAAIQPWIVFFQNVDSIIGSEEPVVYPEHLTSELDYELELAVVLEELGNAQKVRIGGLVQLTVRVKPAQKKRRGRNPATGEEIEIAAKPASVDLRARPLAKAKGALPSVQKARRRLAG